MEVKDRDYTNLFNDIAQDDPINVFAIDIVSTHTVAMSPGTYGYGTISVTTSVQCAESYHGDQCQFVNFVDCEIDINECEDQSCSGNGQCFNEKNNFTCTCYDWFTGELCNIVTEMCINMHQHDCIYSITLQSKQKVR